MLSISNIVVVLQLKFTLTEIFQVVEVNQKLASDHQSTKLLFSNKKNVSWIHALNIQHCSWTAIENPD